VQKREDFVSPGQMILRVRNNQSFVKSVPGLENKMVDDLIVGNAVQEAEQGMQMGRMIALMALGIDNAGMVINRYCGSGIEAIHIASAKVQAGMADCIIAEELNPCRSFR
jgi:acetyl-CoA acyltransferase